MNQLEAETGVTLFVRSRRGISLTDAGKSLYEDAKIIIRLSEDAVARARKIERPEASCIRIGTSVMRSGKRLLELWSGISAEHPGLKVHIVPFDDSFPNYLNTVQNFGKDIDVIAGIYPSGLWGNACNALKLGDIPICCAASRLHPLARKERLDIQDFYGQRLMVVERGNTSHMDAVRDELEKYPEITIMDTNNYDVSVFNECESAGSLMLTGDNWVDVHPMLVTIPVDWDFTVPYGIIYAKEPSEIVLSFLRAIQNRNNTP